MYTNLGEVVGGSFESSGGGQHDMVVGRVELKLQSLPEHLLHVSLQLLR